MTDVSEVTTEAATPDAVIEPAEQVDTVALATGRRHLGGSLVRNLGPLVVAVAFIGFWYATPSLFFSDRKFLVPLPHDVLYVSFIEGVGIGDLWDLVLMVLSDLIPFVDLGVEPDTSVIFVRNMEAIWLTTKVALVGLAVAILAGALLAMIMSQARWVESSLFPYLIALQAVPILALVPLIGSIWGFGFLARTIVCVIIAFFPIVANTLFGLQSANRSHHELFTLHQASRWTRMRKLMIPAALPVTFAGLRIAAGLSVIGAIVGDFFFRRGDPGIGSLLDVYAARLNFEELYGAIILSSLLGIFVFLFFGWLSKFVTGSWDDSNGRS